MGFGGGGQHPVYQEIQYIAPEILFLKKGERKDKTRKRSKGRMATATWPLQPALEPQMGYSFLPSRLLSRLKIEEK